MVRIPDSRTLQRAPAGHYRHTLLAIRARRAETSKAALIREAVRRSLGEPEPTVDPFRDWIGGSDADPAPVDEVVYGS